MKEELEEQLYRNFPKIFTQEYRRYGIACGDGWYSILNVGCSIIQNHIDYSRRSRSRALRYNRALKRALNGDTGGLIYYHCQNKPVTQYIKTYISEDIENAEFREVDDYCKQLVAVQVKEKFGGLRFYYDGGDEYVKGVISMICSVCEITCESCANPGTLRHGGWLRTLCDSCDTKTKKNK